ncbi:hypothetical protein AAW12_24265 [Sphingobacterium sp. Ag1]|uniref:DKNYY domain-containing protein n=1 Tax=Sphingobacterium sp. Ag1 TaxID=1643451 RepID=UPI0006276B48|nr:DKNYY domain-containing protein [Sphingobacterium sp. Ag1]KKO89228.1 hypothetical protein AAW12_24265 [Sphingobacterium sp. Ag1]
MGRKDLGNGFVVIDNNYILHFDIEVYRKFYSCIDFPSFEIIQSNGSTFHYLKDKNHVYLESYNNRFCILPDADPADFQILDFENGMATSGGKDYVFEHKLVYRLADVRELPGIYQLVGDVIYSAYFKKVEDADAASFEVLHGDRVSNVAKDSKHVYFRDEIVRDADADSFSIIAECVDGRYYRECDHTFYATDKRWAFYINSIAKSIKTIKTKNVKLFRFEVRDELGYAFDGEYSYLYGKRARQ